jgi:hypothetical protein
MTTLVDGIDFDSDVLLFWPAVVASLIEWQSPPVKGYREIELTKSSKSLMLKYALLFPE